MIEYITYHKILDYFENYQQSAVGLNSFGDGDLVYFATTNSGTTIYPLMFVTPQLITYDENITTYQFSVIFGDIVNTDMSNQQDVITDMSIQAKRFISQFKRGTFIDEMDIQLPVVGTPFIERFNDHIGGVSLDCSVTIFEDLNACDYYEFEPSPSPSVTPTPTPTCSITTQYLQSSSITIGFGGVIILSLYTDSGLTTPTNAICDYVVSGTFMDASGINNFSRTILSGSSSFSGFTGTGPITDLITTSVIPSCGCVDVIPTITPTPTPTQTLTPTPNSYPVVFVSSGATFDDICSNPQPIPTLYSPQPFYTNAQQLYYDSGLTQFIDWNTTTIFLSTGGTQLYFYGFAPFGLSTYGFTCPSPTPTNTPTSTITPTPTNTPTSTITPTPTNTPTITPTPSPTPAACRTYLMGCLSSGCVNTTTFSYTTCDGVATQITYTGQELVQGQTLCARNLPSPPTRIFGGTGVSVTDIGSC
jgi:hypothetical protein